MNILVVTDLYPIYESEKNTPKTIWDFVQGWKKLGHNVKVIKPNFILNSFIRKKPFYKNGIYGDVENLNYWLPFMGKIKDKIKTDLDNFDIVIAHMPSGSIFANRLKLNIPLVTGVHVSDLEVLQNPIYSLYFKRELKSAYKNAAKIACRSEIIKRKFLKIFPEYSDKIFVAYSGTDAQINYSKTWEKKEKYRIITCANLIKRKNADKVIEACLQMNNVELIIIGDGKELNNLRKMSAKNSNIIFKGYLPHKEVLEEMKKSDIFVLPSQNETFGMVYLEAMASGCITVGLRNDGIDGIIEDKVNGYLCDLDNVTEILESIISSESQNTIIQNSLSTAEKYTVNSASLNYLGSLGIK